MCWFYYSRTLLLRHPSHCHNHFYHLFVVLEPVWIIKLLRLPALTALILVLCFTHTLEAQRVCAAGHQFWDAVGKVEIFLALVTLNQRFNHHLL